MLFFILCVVMGVICIKYIFFNINDNKLFMNIINLLVIVGTYIYGILKIIQKSEVITNFRDIDYYYYYYNIASSYKLGDYLQIRQKEYGFWIVNYYIGKIHNLSEVQYTIVLFSIISMIYILSFMWFFNGKYLDLYYFSIIVFSETSNGMINTVRQGFAIAILLLAYMVIVKHNRIRGLVFAISATLFHTSAIIYPINIIVGYIKKISLVFVWIITIVFLLISMTHLNSLLFGTLGAKFNDNYENYITLSNVYGNSAFTTFPIISIFYGFIMSYLNKFVVPEYKNDSSLLIKCYLLATCIFFAFSFIAYSDRIGKYAWSMVPFILVFIIDRSLMRTQYKKLILVLIPLFFIVISFFMNSGSYFVQ